MVTCCALSAGAPSWLDPRTQLGHVQKSVHALVAFEVLPLTPQNFLIIAFVQMKHGPITPSSTEAEVHTYSAATFFIGEAWTGCVLCTGGRSTANRVQVSVAFMIAGSCGLAPVKALLCCQVDHSQHAAESADYVGHVYG